MSDPQIINLQPVGRTYEVQLPIGYTDLAGVVQRQVSLRKMTGNEEALLYDAGLNNSQLVTELLQHCMLCLGAISPVPGKIISQMYTIDRNYLMVELRRLTLGDQLPSVYTCPYCAQEVLLRDDLGQLSVKRLGEEEKPSSLVVELEDGYPDRSGKLHTEVHLRYPTGIDEEFVVAMVEKDPLKAQDAFLLRCITSFGALQKAALEAYGVKILRDLSLGDRQRLYRVLNETSPGVDFRRSIRCENCHNTFDATLDLTHFFALS